MRKAIFLQELRRIVLREDRIPCTVYWIILLHIYLENIACGSCVIRYLSYVCVACRWINWILNLILSVDIYAYDANVKHTCMRAFAGMFCNARASSHSRRKEKSTAWPFNPLLHSISYIYHTCLSAVFPYFYSFYNWGNIFNVFTFLKHMYA